MTMIGDECLLFVHAKEMISSGAWPTILRFYRDHVNEISKYKALVISDGGGPNAPQRKELHDAIGKEGTSKTRTVVVSDSQIVRFIVSASSLIVRNIRTFESNRFQEALGFLELPEPAQRAVRDALIEIKPQIPTNFRTFHRIDPRSLDGKPSLA